MLAAKEENLGSMCIFSVTKLVDNRLIDKIDNELLNVVATTTIGQTLRRDAANRSTITKHCDISRGRHNIESLLVVS